MKNRLCNRRSALRGATALEFALVFPVLFLMMYGMLSYSYIFAAQHSLSNAAAEGARAAMRFSAVKENINSRKAVACDIAMKSVMWLNNEYLSCDHKSEEYSASNGCILLKDKFESINCLAVNVKYEFARHNIFPGVKLLNFGEIKIPGLLVGSAFTQVALSY